LGGARGALGLDEIVAVQPRHARRGKFVGPSNDAALHAEPIDSPERPPRSPERPPCSPERPPCSPERPPRSSERPPCCVGQSVSLSDLSFQRVQASSAAVRTSSAPSRTVLSAFRTVIPACRTVGRMPGTGGGGSGSVRYLRHLPWEPHCVRSWLELAFGSRAPGRRGALAGGVAFRDGGDFVFSACFVAESRELGISVGVEWPQRTQRAQRDWRVAATPSGLGGWMGRLVPVVSLRPPSATGWHPSGMDWGGGRGRGRCQS
jgi:hypothetical protein